MTTRTQRITRLRALRKSTHPDDVRELASLYVDLIPADPPLIMRARRASLFVDYRPFPQVSTQSNDRKART